jgi:acetyl-CoA C-acetyltransferase
MPEAVIVSAARSPIGRAGKGALRDMRPDDLAADIVSAAVGSVPDLDPSDIDDLMLGCGCPGGEQGHNMGRAVATLLGWDAVPATTVTRYCASSLQTTRMAFHAIKAGEAKVLISAGVETASRFTKGNSDSWPDTFNPKFDAAQQRTTASAEGGVVWHDPRADGALPDIYIAMGQTAENVAQLHAVSRADQDAFALRSQMRTRDAAAAGFWKREITPVTTPDGVIVTADDAPRPQTDAAALAGLKPVFRPDGTVTAGNCCPLNDGAAALVVMSDEEATRRDLTPLARIISTGVSGLSPEIMGLGPVEASKRALAQAGMTIGDVDLVEINEAFAAQVLASARELGIAMDRLNVNGGAIAIGHPFGMSGARIITTMLNSLQWHDKQTGLVTMCVGGGQGMAVIVERLS